ncbi:uroporphyrinogen decarboxylase family protein [Bifidobacterium avesanii]|nr:uroporphyrinogen decarboxylase family protein [Bifidobacterium avesanii]KAB8295500.1 methyltransferase, MtaA/CmuA family [Bifidobacterium avesanii]
MTMQSAAVAPMTKRERMLHAMHNEPVDHVPVGFWFHFDREHSEGEANVKAHLDFYRQTDLDFVKIMCDGFFAYPVARDIVERRAWDEIRPLSADDPWIRGQVERAKAIVEAIGGERCVFYNVFQPFSSFRFSLEPYGQSSPEATRYLKEDPIGVMRAMDAIAQSNALLTELLIREAGCDGVYYCVQGGEYDRFTEREYRTWIAPSDLYVLEHANRFSENNILHMCGWGGNRNRLELWKDYPARTMNWAVFVEGLDLIEGRSFFGGKSCMGGFETHWDGNGHRGVIYDGTKDEVRAYTRDLILDHGKRGLILGGDCTVDAKLDWERMRWVVEAARSL